MNQGKTGTYFKIIYLAAMAVLVFTGFGQMPIFKRYYISEVPGLGWSADFYTGLQVHYYAAMVLLFILFYLGAGFLLSRARAARLSWSGGVRAGLLGLVLVSGLILLLDNLSGFGFSQNILMVSDLVHLGAVMGFLFFTLVCLFTGWRWLEQSSGARPAQGKRPA